MPSNWDKSQPIDAHPETAKLIQGAEAVIQQEIGPLAALCDALRLRLDSYHSAANAAERLERWRLAVVLHSEIMEVWKSAFLNARAAVDAYLANCDLSTFFSCREILVASLHGRCKPSVGIALSVMQFESERNLRRLADASPDMVTHNEPVDRRFLRAAAAGRQR